MFSCEFCKISKNTSFTEHLRTTVSDWSYATVESLFAYFQCCTLFVLYFLHAELFLCSTFFVLRFFMLHYFVIFHFSYCTLSCYSLPCCTNFKFHSFRVACVSCFTFSCCNFQNLQEIKFRPVT